MEESWFSIVFCPWSEVVSNRVLGESMQAGEPVLPWDDFQPASNLSAHGFLRPTRLSETQFGGWQWTRSIRMLDASKGGSLFVKSATNNLAAILTMFFFQECVGVCGRYIHILMDEWKIVAIQFSSENFNWVIRKN